MENNLQNINGGDNALTANEKEQGFILLFDGETFDGWRTFQNKPGSWQLEHGTFYCHKLESNRYADLVTSDKYEDFEFHIDWKMEPRGNSGLMYMVTEEYEETYLSGPEYQILDDASFKNQIDANQATGAVYAIKGPAVEALKPVGEWNHSVIIVDNTHVEHWLNGVKMVEYELWGEEWKAARDTGKWNGVIGYGATKQGHIAIQDYHGEGRVWFKNAKHGCPRAL